VVCQFYYHGTLLNNAKCTNYTPENTLVGYWVSYLTECPLSSIGIVVNLVMEKNALEMWMGSPKTLLHFGTRYHLMEWQLTLLGFVAFQGGMGPIKLVMGPVHSTLVW
jgi:hypothetical protein